MDNQLYIPFGQIMAGPLLAMIEGETLAAQATTEFIEKAGFIKSNSDADNFGRLRTVSFSYVKRNFDGQLEEATLTVPLLSLIPIPLLQIQKAHIEFGLDLTTQPKPNEPPGKSLKTVASGLPSKTVNTYGMVKSLPNGSTTDVRSQMQMKVQIEVGPSDIPAGLSKIFQVFDTVVDENKALKKPK